MTQELQHTLEELTALPSTELPFLSIYLDMAPDGSNTRQGLIILEQELRRLADRYEAHTPEQASFEADRARILDYVRRGVPDEVRGVAIFACHGAGVWRTVELQIRLDTEISVDRYPRVFHLARLVDDYETCAVVLASGQNASIVVFALDRVTPAASTEAPEKIKRFQQGGTAQMMFQRRTDNLIKAHIKEIGARLAQVVERYNVAHIVFAGNDSIKGIVLDTLDEHLKARILDYVALDPRSNLGAVREAIAPLLEQAERQQEQSDLDALADQLATVGGLAVAGKADTALALSKGQVRTLVMLHSFGGTGGECTTCNTLRAGDRSRCPYDGGEMRPVELREAFLARAMQQGSRVQIVRSSDLLDQHEGVGAMLYYRDDELAKENQVNG
jgi:peptide subunit release factor 1 (eRF1)